MFKEFVAFLKQYGVVGLAIAVVIGGKVNEFVTATVTDLIMPVIGAVLPNGSWETWVLVLGPLHFALGHWIGVAIDFVIIAFFVFIIARLVLRERDLKGKYDVKKENVDTWKDAQGTSEP